MSGEIAQATPEATVYSSEVPKDLPNSYNQTQTTTDPDFSNSAASPGASTFLNSASTTTQASPAEGTSGVVPNNHSSPAKSTSLSPDEIHQPSTGSGAEVQAANSTDSRSGQLGAAATSAPEQSSRRGSRGSVKVPSRKGSAASGRLVKKDKAANSAVGDPEKGGELESSENTAKPKRKGLSSFLSRLSCCGGSKDDQATESDQAVPPKKAKTLQSNRGRQTTPMTQANASAGESSNTESKEVIVDSIAGPPYSELAPAAKPKIIEPREKATPAMEKPGMTNGQLPSTMEEKSIPAQSTSGDQPLPALPAGGALASSNNRDVDMANAQEPFNEKSAAPGADGLVEPHSSPAVVAVADQNISKEDMAINDRTPQQEARDVEMTEAPPAPVVPEQQPVQQEPIIQSVPQTNLPPPPPIVPPTRPPAADRRTSNGMANAEQQKWLLPPLDNKRFGGKKCLVLDLDETLVHSSFKILHQADFTIPVEIEGQYHNVYVIKRPGVDQFMKRVGELYEVVVFTASVSKYGDPLLDQLDIHNVVHHRLFRESCYNHQGNYVKDLSQVGRDLRETIIIDNSPTSYIFHPQHAVPISSWFSDAHDNELLDLIPVLEDLAGPRVRDVSLVLDVGL
ncbi:MAG: hypothetical protein Q9174_004814 [Haloplaca sp. 1 TL-2023]